MTESVMNKIYVISELFEGIIFIGFLTLFFKCKYIKKISVTAYIVTALIFFGAVLYLNNISKYGFFYEARYYKQYIISIYFYSHFNYSIDDLKYLAMFIEYAKNNLIYILIYFIYCAIFLKGKKSFMFITTVLSFIIHLMNVLISQIVIYYVFMKRTGLPIHLIQQTYLFKILLIILTYTLDIFIFLLIIQLLSNKTFSISRKQTVTFMIIPVLIMILVGCCAMVFGSKEDTVKLLILSLLMVLISIMISLIYIVLFLKIREINSIRTDYLLTKQKMELYEESVLKSSKQIEKMSKIKHDMKNYLLSIGNLLKNKEYNEAEKLCIDISENLQKVHTPINTSNILLNSIINIEIDKAENESIDFGIEISDCLSNFCGNSDIISVIGNICDNAIEYLKTQPREQRSMSLSISAENNHTTIVCRSKINDSNFENFTAVADDIAERICEKYNGNILCEASNDEFITTILFEK